MKSSKKARISAISIFVISIFLFVAPVVHAAVPVLSLTSNSDGDSVQVNVAGDPNASVLFYYTKTGAGQQISTLGSTNSSGNLSVSISSAAYGIATNTSVYVTVGGINGSQSNSVAWPYVLSSSTNTLSLSQGGLVLTVGQSSTITANNSSLYLSNNSNPPIANVNISGSQIAITANSYGSTVVTVCELGSTSSCSSIYVTVQNNGAAQISLSQSSVSITSGQSVPVTISGASGLYSIVNNSNPSIIQASLSGAVITLTTSSTSGSSSITVCSIDNSSCGVINVTATNVSSSALNFSQATPTISVGGNIVITIYGISGSSFYVASNSNPSMVQANLVGSTLTLLGNAAGSSIINICSSVSSCGNIAATVTSASTGGPMQLSQNSVSILVGQSLNITISGGLMPYSMASSNSGNIFQANINGNTLTLYGVSSGSSSTSVCSSGGGCIGLTVAVNGQGQTNQLILSQNNLSLSVGQGTTVYITGNGSYYVASNSNPSAVSASISGSSIIVSALAAGTTNISVCQNGGQCATLSVTVSNMVSQSINPVVVQQQVVAQTPFLFRYLGFGDKGEDVLALQKWLVKKGFLSATPNGHYGLATVAAVKRLQKAYGIKILGSVGPSTKNILNQLNANYSSPAQSDSARQQQIQQVQQAILQLQSQLSAMLQTGQ